MHHTECVGGLLIMQFFYTRDRSRATKGLILNLFMRRVHGSRPMPFCFKFRTRITHVVRSNPEAVLRNPMMK